MAIPSFKQLLIASSSRQRRLWKNDLLLLLPLAVRERMTESCGIIG